MTSARIDPADFARLIRRYRTGPDATPNILALFIRYGSAYRWLAVSTTMVGAISTMLASTTINVAIPEVMGAFGIGQIQAQWLATGFLAATTVTMLLSPWMIRALGMKITYILGMGGFMAGSLLGGVSPGIDMLIASRVIMGAASGLIGPLGMLIMFQVFPPEQRGRAMGIFGIGVILAPALGPTLGGVLCDALSWRWVFLAAVPVCALSIPMALLFIPARDETGPWPLFDWIGLLLMSVCIPALLIGLSSGQGEGWGSPFILICFTVAGASGTAFVVWESLHDEPMLNLRLFTNGAFVAAAVVTFVFGAGLYGSTYLVPIFLQTVQRLTPTESGLIMMPPGLALALVFPFMGALSDRVSARALIVWGLLIFAISSYLMTAIDVDTSFWTLVWWILIGRVGLGLVMPTLSRTTLMVLPFDLLAQGSSAANFLRQLGGAFGVNALAIQIERRTQLYGDGFSVSQTLANSETSELLRLVRGLLVEAGTTSADALAGAVLYLARAIYTQASVLAYRDGFLIVAAMFLLTLIPAWFMGGKAVMSPADASSPTSPRVSEPIGDPV